MRIVIDARMLYATGIGRYARELLAHYEASGSEHQFIVLMRPKDSLLWSPTHPNFTRVWAPYNPYTLGEQLKLPWLIRGLKPDVVHFPSFNAPLLYPFLAMSPTVVTIHDLTLVDHHTSRYTGIRKMVQGYKQLPFLMTLRTVIRRADAVITDTDFVRQQVQHRYQPSSSNLTSIALGAESASGSPASLERYGINGKFLLYVGNYYPYKNIGALIEAFAKLPSTYKLVLCGREDYFAKLLRSLVSELGVSDRVIFTGFVTDDELAGLYQKATLYTFPSLSEGFGLPGLEAMAHGTPVIAARATCLPEVYGDAAAYFEDPTNSDAMARDLRKLLEDEPRLKKLAEAGPKHVKKFSWEDTAKQTLAVYERVAKKA